MSSTTTPAPVSPTPKNITSSPPSSSPSPPTAQSPSSPTSPPPPKSFTSPPPPTTHSSSSPPPPPKTSNGSNTLSSTGINSSSFATTAIVGVAVAGVVGVLLLCILIACCCRKKRKTRPELELLPVQDHGAPPQPSRGSKQPLPPPSPGIGVGISRTFTYQDLEIATNGFSETNLLGVGGFGHVYKGILPGSKIIAVKKLKDDGRQVEGMQWECQFQAEVEIISRVHHRHLVSLVGYCIAGSQRLLVYEFVPNDTLEHHLHVEAQPTLDWPTRLKIARGAACGLAYLHEHCYPKIIHRDIKASNILLDSNFEAKIADFGLAKLVSESFTHIFTRVAGSYGYLAPEYASSGILTYKSDVYSFGVLLLELITGHRPIDRTKPFLDDGLVYWARPLLSLAMENGNVDALADIRIQHNYNVNEMMRVVACAASCVRRSARMRPCMGQIVRVLEGAVSLDDLEKGVRPGHSTVYGSIGSSDYDTNQYSEHGSDYSGATSEFGFSSGEDRQDPRTVGHQRIPSRSSLGSDYSGASSEYGLNQSVSANMDDNYGGRPQYWENNAPQPGDNAVKICPLSSPLSHPVIPKPLPSPPDVMPPPPPPPPVFRSGDDSSSGFSGSKQPLPPPSPGIGLGISRTFTYEDLEMATNGFSQTNLLAGRGSGHVYRGTLPGSKTIAVKQLKVDGSQGKKFRALGVGEILSRLHHRHLASFVGYCIAGSQLLLVYEFGPNDTLEPHLHVKGPQTMDWRTRFKIAKGVARGLAYLHEECDRIIIHGDIKASNIFLDIKYQAKVAGFGLAAFDSERLPIVCPNFFGNSREVAQEYASITDVYSFGVLLLELITGRPVDTISFPEESLVDWARPLLALAMEDGNVDALADIRIQHNYNSNEMIRVVACAASCVRRTEKRPPRMGQIVHALEGLVSLDDL